VEVDSRFRGNDSDSELKWGADFPDGILMPCFTFVLIILERLPPFSIS